MTIYREVSVTREERDSLNELGALVSRLGILGVRGLGRYACVVQDIVERFDESPAEWAFPAEVVHRHIDEVAADAAGVVV